ncbi:MAG: ArsR/SmtB family transcription factor [Nitrosopumilus sp.]
MPTDNFSEDDLTEKIKILATDDEKIKSFGELFTNDSSREILQLLFNEELSATQIAQKTNVSLQLVKYHLNKLQDLGIVKISKIEKNSKSQDMKIYSAIKFSIVIVPPKLSEKTKESKLLVRSFKHIYKIAGLGIATGLSGLFSLFTLQQDRQVVVNDSISEQLPKTKLSDNEFEMSESISSDKSIQSAPTAAPSMSAESETSKDFDDIMEPTLDDPSNFNVEEHVVNNENGILINSDLFTISFVITLILGGITIVYLWKYFKKSKS